MIMPKLGPGTLTIGATGTEVDASCLVNNAKITSEKEQADSTTKLCGTVKQGSITYTWTLEGNVDTDPAETTGLFQLCMDNKGTEQAFTFVPNTEDGTAATGTLIVDPLDFGADNYGDDMTSDFSFAIVGEPVYGPAPVTPLDTDTTADSTADSTADAGDLVTV